MNFFFKLLAISSIIVYLGFPLIKKDDVILNNIQKIENIEKIETVFYKNEMIVGSSGKKVDINKSYLNMINEDEFNNEKLVFKIDKIEISKDYKIIGKQTNEKIISIIINLNENDKKLNIENLSYFATPLWYEENLLEIDGIYDFNEKDLPWLSFKTKYCLSSEVICNKYNMYTIDIKTINNNFYYYLKKNLKPGEIFIFDLNEELKSKINLIVNYVKIKGYQIKKIENLLNT